MIYSRQRLFDLFYCLCVSFWTLRVFAACLELPNWDKSDRIFKQIILATSKAEEKIGQQMHGIGGRRLVYKEVVEVGSNFKNSYFWWFGSDSARSIRLCVWRKSRELGGRGSPRFPTSMLESFSTDLLSAIKIYWAETHLELFILLQLNPGARGEYLTRLLTTLRSKQVERL